MAVLALDLGGTKLSGAIVDSSGTLSFPRQELLSSRKDADVGDFILAFARDLYRTAGENGTSVTGIGICVPGIAYPESGDVWAPNIPGWNRYPLREKLRTCREFSSLSVGIGSDRDCSILGEVWLGAARGCRNALFLAVGTGIGLGIYTDGRVLSGAQGIAGSIGWMALCDPFLPEYEKCGCFESYASGLGIADRMRHFLAENGPSSAYWRTIPPDTITFRHVFAAHQAGDTAAGEILSRAILMWGMATANLISLFNPERILFGGGLFGPAVALLPRIAQEAARWAQPISMQQVEILPAGLGTEAALYGSARMVLPPSE